MKKWIFTLLLFFKVAVAGVNQVYANVLWISGNYYKLCYSTRKGEDSTEYTFYVEFSDIDKVIFETGYKPFICFVDSTEYTHVLFNLDKEDFTYEYDETNGKDIAYWSGKYVFSDDYTIRDVKMRFYIGDYEINYVYGDDITEPEPTPSSTPTPTPSPSPEPTPEPEDTPTPEPTPTNTPKLTPMNTPTPTPSPTPAPILQLDAYVDGSTAVAKYYTGGCTPVKSMIEYYEVGAGDVLSKLNGETFLSGAGTMKNSMDPGKVYRYKLTYIYQRDGIQYEEFLWSDDLSIVDQELEDYRNSGKITNFRTLMLYTWEEIMELDIPVDGFKLKARDLFIWIMIASLGIFFWKKWNGG